ncbi:MAG: hypothetical protein ACI88A_004847 [Paraglaciecola sp.]|jgi:hypothetical protein
MKTTLKHHLSRLGILPHLDALRRFSETHRWIGAGCTGLAPPPVKRKILMAYLRKYGLNEFVETGTHLGDTLAYMAYDKNIHCTSIELADGYYQQAKRRIESYPNITLIHGDSGALMPEVVRQLAAPALFWLDGHYSGGLTGQGDIDSPISAELEAILTSPCKTHVILIDDARFFDGSNGYPYLDVLLKTVREQSNYCAEVTTDIIRLTPNS